jgi:N-acetylneuraminic acid mutarotase
MFFVSVRSSRRLSMLIVPLAAALGGCGGEREPAPGEALRLGFPEQADSVLASAHAFTAGERSFLASSAATTGGVRAELPIAGEDAVRLSLAEGDDIRVREVGAHGAGVIAEHAVAYHRAGGTSFWTALPGGVVEEWLHLDASAVPASGVAAAWEIEGARPEQRGDAVALMDAGGRARLWVTAPVAYGAGGRLVGAHLAVRGATLELTVDARGEALLIDPSWSPAAPMVAIRSGHASAILPSGKVLVMGGYTPSISYLASAEVYDPATNSWSAASSMSVQRAGHRATVLADGRVLVTGGTNGTTANGTAEIYDPGTSTWSAAGSIAGRSLHSSTLLTTGKVLVHGGDGATDANLYDPSTNTWSSAASTNLPHDSGATLRLADGRVLVAGGYSTTYVLGASAEIYDPTADTWTRVADRNTVCLTEAAPTLLPSGSVLVAGGFGGNTSTTAMAITEIYDPGANTWTYGASMSTARAGATGTTLGDGTFLVAGGDNGSVYLNSSERYDPATGAWTFSGNLGAPREGHTADLLASGKVLASGGDTRGIHSSELWSSASGSGTSCTSPSQCSSGFCVDGMCCNTACGGGSTTDCLACSVAAGAPTNGTCAALTTGRCAPTCVTVQRGTSGTVADAHIVSNATTTNYGANALLSTGGVGGSTRYGLIRFDLSTIPATSVVTSATLTVGAFGGGGPAELVHRVTASWAESTVTWGSFGGAFNAPVEVSMTGSPSVYTGSVTPLVQSWVNGTFSNYGVLLERDLTAGTTLYASEYATVSSRPRLDVCYHP